MPELTASRAQSALSTASAPETLSSFNNGIREESVSYRNISAWFFLSVGNLPMVNDHCVSPGTITQIPSDSFGELGIRICHEQLSHY